MATLDSMASIVWDYHAGVRRRVEGALNKVRDAIDEWIDGALEGPLPDDWREQFAAVLEGQTAQCRRVLPESARQIEAWIEGWAGEYGLLPTGPPMEHWARWRRSADSPVVAQTSAPGAQTVTHSPDGSFVIQVTPEVSGPPESEVDLTETEEVAGPGPKTSQSFQDQVRLILEIVEPDIAEWWSSARGELRSRDATSWGKFLRQNYYSDREGNRPIVWVDVNFTTAQAAEAIITLASDPSSIAGQLYRQWRASRHDAPTEFAAWRRDATAVSFQQAAALARIYYGSLASLSAGGDLVVTVHDIGEEGFSWPQLLSLLPLMSGSGKFAASSLTVVIVNKSSHATRLLKIPQALLKKLHNLSDKARSALITKAKAAKNEKEALAILEDGVEAGARQVPFVKPPFPKPVAAKRVTNMKGRDYPHPSHVKAAQSEERLAHDIHKLEDEVVLQWGKPIGSHGADIISYNHKTKKITLWDDKYRSAFRRIQASKTFEEGRRPLEQSIDEARAAIGSSSLSVGDKDAALHSLDTNSFRRITQGSGNARNSTIGVGR